MGSLIDVRNVRINFRFMVIVNEFNFFYIQLFDLGEFVYMKENSYCKYEKMLYVLEKVQWWIFFVCEVKGEEKMVLYCFILCIK